MMGFSCPAAHRLKRHKSSKPNKRERERDAGKLHKLIAARDWDRLRKKLDKYAQLCLHSDGSPQLNVDIGETDDKLVDSIKIYIDAVKRVEVKDRVYHLRTCHRCFVGSEVVDILVLSGLDACRYDAVRIGRLLQSTYLLFDHVCSEHEFEDSYLFYKFNKEIISADIEDIIKQYHKVAVKDRTYHLKKYKICSIGKDAVTLLVATGVSAPRTDALKIGRILQNNYFLFDHVCGDHPLQDEH